MKTLFKASIALGIVLSLSGAAYPVVAPSHRTVQQMAKLAKAPSLLVGVTALEEVVKDGYHFLKDKVSHFWVAP